MKRVWIYLINTFLVVTQNSFLLAQKIVAYHLNALTLVKADAFFKPLYDVFKPLADQFDAAFTNWKSGEAVQLSDSQRLNDLFTELSASQIETWDINIQIVHKQKSPEYKKLLPKRRGPFQKGTQQTRLQAVKNLSNALIGEAKLVDVKNSVDDFLARFETNFDVQKQSIQATEKLRDVLEAKRQKICVELYRNLGLLMAHFAENPEDAAVYFPLPFLRRTVQVSFTNSVKPLAIKFIAKRKLVATDEITIFNTSDTALTFYFSEKKTGLPDAKTAFTIQPNDIQSITAGQLGDPSLSNILVYNPSSSIGGHYQFDID